MSKKRRLDPGAHELFQEKVPQYLQLIYKMAHKYVRHRVEYDDLVQEALWGLAEACRDYDPDRSEDFHTYAIYRMKGRMYEFCISNESPIYAPTHVAKAASYVRQMQRLLEKEPRLEDADLTMEIISVREHPAEKNLGDATVRALRELKRKLGNIGLHSHLEYEKLTALACESLSMIVSDDALTKFTKENEYVDDIVSGQELTEQLRESLGEKRFTVLMMRRKGWTLREIAERLEKLGYTNKQGQQISRQAVKAILDETLKIISRTRILNEGREDLLKR
jgi:RNA polymerase sigma factor (sigma-70 family)